LARHPHLGGMLPKIKYIAGYQTQPVSAITHVAPVARIEPYGDNGKYQLLFSEPAKEIVQIPLGKAPPGAMQAPCAFVRRTIERATPDVHGRPRSNLPPELVAYCPIMRSVDPREARKCRGKSYSFGGQKVS
jgi:hypothetical protein